MTEYCSVHRIAVWMYLFPAITSLIQLSFLSVERYTAIKYSLKYDSIVTSTRLTVAVVCSWLVANVQALGRFGNSHLLTVITFYFTLSTVFLSILVIIYCQIVLYFVSRRHMKQIKSELVSRGDTVKFLKEKKALITTTIIIGVVFMSYTPVIFFSIARFALPSGNYTVRLISPLRPLGATCILINSIFNPIIYCWRNKKLRKAFFELLSRRAEHF